MSEIWSYEGKRVVIAGCYSGIGAACAHELVRLGAEVHGVDIKASPVPLASFTQVDFQEFASIDAAVGAVGGEIDALFNCVGLPQTFPPRDVVNVNFLGTRRWTEGWIPRVRRGGAIVSVSSVAGRSFEKHLPLLNEFIATADQQAGLDWAAAHPDAVGDGYGFAKEAIIVWTMDQAVALAGQGVRINCVCPGPTQTPMLAAFEQVASLAVIDVLTAPSGRRSTPEEQAYPLIFLNSDAASFISGVALPVDGGFMGGVTSGRLDLRAMIRGATAKPS